MRSESESVDVTTREGRLAFAETYRQVLLEDVIPFWLRCGLDSGCDAVSTTNTAVT